MCLLFVCRDNETLLNWMVNTVTPTSFFFLIKRIGLWELGLWRNWTYVCECWICACLGYDKLRRNLVPSTFLSHNYWSRVREIDLWNWLCPYKLILLHKIHTGAAVLCLLTFKLSVCVGEETQCRAVQGIAFLIFVWTRMCVGRVINVFAMYTLRVKVNWFKVNWAHCTVG